MGNIKLSIILINYNSSHYTLDCVQSIQEKTTLNAYELVIVDNNSGSDDFEALAPLKDRTNIKVVRSRINLGFAGGNMFGVQLADPSAEYLFFLNNDCVFRNDAVQLLTDYLAANQNVAACTGQIFNGAGEKEQSFDYLPELSTKILGRTFRRKTNPEAFPHISGNYTQPIFVPVITGCAMMVRASAFSSISGFDTNLFLYCEEEDLCKRFGDAGFKIAFVPAAEIVHFGGKSTSVNWDVQKEFYISFFYYFKKYYSGWQVFFLKWMFFLKNFRKGFKHKIFFRLAFFILSGASPGTSLRFRQRIN